MKFEGLAIVPTSQTLIRQLQKIGWVGSLNVGLQQFKCGLLVWNSPHIAFKAADAIPADSINSRILDMFPMSLPSMRIFTSIKTRVNILDEPKQSSLSISNPIINTNARL
ncbi:unnamed protein product [Blumeria hordei]|uniref:Uncharacterized protein n=1 Tax=Blumeria hordei TaxID=2867405 RepID=A0A383UMC7_BLUHO|nr:unnamed protein product [Blumeria hordei]